MYSFAKTRDAGHIIQSIALIASNGAALLPAYWALRQRVVFLLYASSSMVFGLFSCWFIYPKQEYPEWFLFTSSGISSALYHACDVGTWCVLSYNVLQVRVVIYLLIIAMPSYTLLQNGISFFYYSVYGFLALFHGGDWYLCVLIHGWWSSQEDNPRSCCHSHSFISLNSGNKVCNMLNWMFFFWTTTEWFIW